MPTRGVYPPADRAAPGVLGSSGETLAALALGGKKTGGGSLLAKREVRVLAKWVWVLLEENYEYCQNEGVEYTG